MVDKQKIRKIVSETIGYECPVCKEKYASIEEAKKCAAPKEPRYKLGGWVMTSRHITRVVPGGDESSREYDEIAEGSYARISDISDENKTGGTNKAHPAFVYGFDIGKQPLIFYHVKESFLEKISNSVVERIKARYAQISVEAEGIEAIIDDME
ncbi:MAG: hypothetical protein U9R34_02830 [Nanoarchaeota archaeon]|nr:hypothetical protein [Nanoarchaeota archaeon]